MQYYEVTLRNGHKVRLSVERFKSKFPKGGGNFQERLKQIRYFFPDAVDWTIDDKTNK